MDKDTRSAIERATQHARTLLEADFAAQLDGDFDVHLDGAVAAKAGSHLSVRQVFQRERIIAAIDHKRASGMSESDTVRDYLRDAAFTTLNRFVALKMLEARELMQECISKGEQSAGYREFCGMAPGLPLLPDSAGYRLYIESLFDELSTEVKVLFDRRDPSSVLWPKRATFERLLEILNTVELLRVWGEDETIGWVYQFFNGQDERRRMRDASQAPRNSRELAVRNQFFTPRYVVQFLTDNTLGRIWYEMRGTKTALVEKCEYMVRKPNEEFAARTMRDPRDLRVLDPACGSGHFLLYAFDLLLTIYEEAHSDPDCPISETTGRTLAEDYPNPDALRKDIPSLILAHNLHGVDIDPRCTQIAQLALWMRAQKTYREFGVERVDRAEIRRSNIVVAEPLVADDEIAREFVAKLGDLELGRVFTALVESFKLAGDLGVLLLVEQLAARQTKRDQTAELAPPEERIRAALDRFVHEGETASNTRRRLFADDAAHAVALLGVAEKRFDVVLMNPPFGLPTERAAQYVGAHYVLGYRDLYACFVERAQTFVRERGGKVGAITSRQGFFLPSQEEWRKAIGASVELLVDLGHGVLDSALVETAAYIIDCSSDTLPQQRFIDLLSTANKEEGLRAVIARLTGHPNFHEVTGFPFQHLPGGQLAYWAPAAVLNAYSRLELLEPSFAVVRAGLSTCDDFRFLRLWWEVPRGRIGAEETWSWFAKGGEYAPFHDPLQLVVKWSGTGHELEAYGETIGNAARARQSSSYYFRPGVTYPVRTTSGFGPRLLPPGAVFGHMGATMFPNREEDVFTLLAISMSRAFATFLELSVGLGDSVTSGSAARRYSTGVVGTIPIPPLSDAEKRRLSDLSTRIVHKLRTMRQHDETSPYFAGPRFGTLADDGLHPDAERQICAEEDAQLSVLRLSLEMDSLVNNAYGFDACAEEFVERVTGRHPCSFQHLEVDTEVVVDLWSHGIDAMVDHVTFAKGSSRQTTKKTFFVDRRLELACVALEVAPEAIVQARRVARARPAGFDESYLLQIVSFAVGAAFGRWRLDASAAAEITDELPPFPPASARARSAVPILVEDRGHKSDIVGLAEAASLNRGDVAGGGCGEDLRRFIRSSFFDAHLRAYSGSRRRAPIYWQLATPSTSYSVWLYAHGFSKDTLFRVQNEYVSPKLEHEERRLESLMGEMRDVSTAAQRKELAAQEAFVDELRTFVEQVKAVAPMWNPNLNDGVIINFALLWRLVPQHKPWQKELKLTWDALCDGQYDWAHLAMQLWPERVVLKCAKERSLSIAHGLEDVFWTEGTDGKWTARKTSAGIIDELVRERTSSAVKSALKSLLEMPSANGSGEKAKKGKANA